MCGAPERRRRDLVFERAAEPTVTKPGVFDSDQIAEVEKTAALGTLQFQLIGVPDFLSAEGLLRSGDRALFTSPEQVNATVELRDGRTVLVKGLLIDPDAEPLINLLVVVGMPDLCRLVLSVVITVTYRVARRLAGKARRPRIPSSI